MNPHDSHIHFTSASVVVAARGASQGSERDTRRAASRTGTLTCPPGPKRHEHRNGDSESGRKPRLGIWNGLSGAGRAARGGAGGAVGLGPDCRPARTCIKRHPPVPADVCRALPALARDRSRDGGVSRYARYEPLLFPLISRQPRQRRSRATQHNAARLPREASRARSATPGRRLRGVHFAPGCVVSRLWRSGGPRQERS
jgi:hypothetical protein